MSTFLNARRRHVNAKGRAMLLSRVTVAGGTPVSVTVQGLPTSAFRTEQLPGDVKQGDQVVSILNDEIALAAWPGPPRARDTLLLDGRTWVVQGSAPLFEGAALIGHDVWIRGGTG